MVADVAAILHWSPDSVGDLEVNELLEWHALAMERLKVQFMLAGYRVR